MLFLQEEDGLSLPFHSIPSLSLVTEILYVAPMEPTMHGHAKGRECSPCARPQDPAAWGAFCAFWH